MTKKTLLIMYLGLVFFAASFATGFAVTTIVGDDSTGLTPEVQARIDGAVAAENGYRQEVAEYEQKLAADPKPSNYDTLLRLAAQANDKAAEMHIYAADIQATALEQKAAEYENEAKKETDPANIKYFQDKAAENRTLAAEIRKGAAADVASFQKRATELRQPKTTASGPATAGTAPTDTYQTLINKATALEQQADAIQSVNPAGAQALRSQAAGFRAQAQALIGAPSKVNPIYQLIVPIPGLPTSAISNPLEYIKGIYNFGIGLGLLVAVATIVFAGLKWATSAGNVSATSEAKDMILNAVYGVVMLLGAVLILRTINPSLTKLTIPDLTKIGKTKFDFAQNAAEWQKLNKDWQGANAQAHKSRDAAEAMSKEMEAKNAKGEVISLDKKIDNQQKMVNANQDKMKAATADVAIKYKAYTDAVAACEADMAHCKLNYKLLGIGGDKGYNLRAAVEDNLKAYNDAVANEARIYQTYTEQIAI